EKNLFERVTELRTEAVSAVSPARLAGIESALQHDLGRLIMIKEAYPELKASENFLKLQKDLVDVEDHLQYARRFYNGAVRELNDGVQRFPDSLIANAFGVKAAEFFDAPEGAQAAPQLGLAS
ncbi:MAG: LemA family protein, partial [Arenimonas sp.]